MKPVFVKIRSGLFNVDTIVSMETRENVSVVFFNDDGKITLSLEEYELLIQTLRDNGMILEPKKDDEPDNQKEDELPLKNAKIGDKVEITFLQDWLDIDEGQIEDGIISSLHETYFYADINETGISIPISYNGKLCLSDGSICAIALLLPDKDNEFGCGAGNGMGVIAGGAK